uniref:Ice-binding protein 3 n=1 Tax=Chloromonas brevispina TaxID=201318 RepID=A0A060KRR4_9CHLO|nr:ice-binding protein 3 [Chloromonas brevispina]
MAQSMSVIVLLCAVLALNGVVGRELKATYTCTTGCSTLLSSAANFGVLASSTITNNGFSTIMGSAAIYPGTDVVGFPPGNITGTLYVGGAVAVKAVDDAQNAYDVLVAMPYNSSADLSGQDLVGMNLTAGKYFFSGSAQLSGNLTLNAQGNRSAIFVIQTSSTFTTSARSNVNLINGAKSCNVFYAVGSSATIHAGSNIRGSVLAYAAVTVGTQVSFHAR